MEKAVIGKMKIIAGVAFLFFCGVLIACEKAEDYTDYRALSVDISFDGKLVELKVCNPTKNDVTFLDNLQLYSDDIPFGLFYTEKVREHFFSLSPKMYHYRETFGAGDFYYWPSKIRQEKMLANTCKSKAIDLVENLLEDEWLEKKGVDDPYFIEKFQVRVVLFKDKYGENKTYTNYEHREFVSEWFDFTNRSAFSEKKRKS